MAYGLLPTGFNPKPSSVIESEIDAGLRKILGDSAGTEADGSIPNASFAGQLKTLLTDGFAAFWDIAQALYSSWNPDGAVDEAQDNVCAITGTIRHGARFSTVIGSCTGTPGTSIDAASVATVVDTNARFATLAADTIVAATAWAASTPYVQGNRVTANGRVFQCITGGTSAGVGSGPSADSEDITDGTAHWRTIGSGTGVVDILFQAEVAGQIGADSGDLNAIATPLSGWTSVKNMVDAIKGRLIETNPSLRVRREQELAQSGNSVPDAIRANLLDVTDVETCRVFYNDTDLTDADGVPPHAVEVLVQGGDDQDVFDAIFASVGAGIGTHGTETGTATDSEGITHTVKFSRPAEVDIWIIADVTTKAGFPSSGGSALVKTTLVTAGGKMEIGDDAVSAVLSGAIIYGPTSSAPEATPLQGVKDVTKLWIGTSNPPIAATTIAITTRQLAVFDTSRITVNLTAAGEP